MTTLAMASPVRGPVWRPTAAALALLLALILLLYRDTAAAMVAIWERSGNFAHAFVVPPIALWLIWRCRAELGAVQPRPAPSVLVVIALLALLWLLGELAIVNSATQLALVGLLVATVPLLAGVAATRVILFPLGFLFFAVPIGEFLMPQMMVWTADFTVLALRATGIPVYREAQQIVIPTGTWSVVEACSGIRYLMASVMVGTLFAYLNYRTLSRRFAFVAVSILVPIVANWVRAYLIVLIGHLSGNRLAVGVDHIVYGWLFFGAVVLVMFAIGARWAEPPPSSKTRSEPAKPATPRRWEPAIVAATATAFIALPQWAANRLELPGPGSGSAVVLSSLNPPLGGWHASDRPVAEWRPAYIGAEAEALANFASGDGSAVGLYVGYYRHQNAERKLVSSENVIVKSGDRLWLQVASGSKSLEVGSRAIRFSTARLLPRTSDGLPGEAGLTVWQVYWVNGRLTSSDVVAKVLTALNRLVGRGDDGAALMFYSHRPEAIEDFVRANLGAIDATLERARSTLREPETRREVRR